MDSHLLREQALLDDTLSSNNTVPKEASDTIPISSTVFQFGECNIPSYFIQKQEQLQACTEGMSKELFKLALFLNTVFSFIFYKVISPQYVLGFIIFHVLLYYFITRIFVSVSISEWKLFKAFHESVKKDPSFSKFDTPVQQFNTITQYLREQPITKQKMIYIILIVSFLFVWIPLLLRLVPHKHHRIADLVSGK